MEYDFMKWNVDLIQDPNVLLKKLKSLDIKDKVIKDIIIVGRCFGTGNYSWIIRDNEKVNRSVEIDAPLIIVFEDDSRLEIDYTDGSTLKVGYNSLPKDITSSSGHNVDGNVMFSNCIGKKICGFYIEMTEEDINVDFCESYGLELSENQDAYISRLTLGLSDGLYFNFNNHYDYGHVCVTDRWHNVTKIKWEELKEGFHREDYNKYIEKGE